MTNPIRDEWQSDDGSIRLILGDCLEVVPTLDNLDAVVIDPPYGIAYQHGGGGKKLSKGIKRFSDPIYGDDEPFDPSPWTDYPIVAMFGANHYAQRLPESGTWIAWDKSLGIGPNDSFADAEFVWTNQKVKRNVIRVLWKGIVCNKTHEDGLYKGSVVRRHPSQKPIELLLTLMDVCNIPAGATVLDGYAGSGSLAIACIRTNRRFIGIEIERKYWAASVDRVRAELARFPLITTSEQRQLELLDPDDVPVDSPA